MSMDNQTQENTMEESMRILKYLEHNHGDVYDAHGDFKPQIYGLLYNCAGTKDVLNRQYDYTGQRRLTKGAFGGLGEIRTLDSLRLAADIVASMRGFKPHYFESISLEILEAINPAMEFQWSSLDTVAAFLGYKDKTFKAVMAAMFGPANYVFTRLDACITGVLHHSTNDTEDVMTMAKAVIEAVKKKFHGEPCLFVLVEFFETEMSKLYEPKREIAGEFYDLVDGHEINNQIKVIAPKTTHDLVEWGAQQNNCLGKSFNTDGTYGGTKIIIGFQKPDGSWWGHAEIAKDKDDNGYVLVEMAGHSNVRLTGEVYRAITEYLVSINVGLENTSSVV